MRRANYVIRGTVGPSYDGQRPFHWKPVYTWLAGAMMGGGSYYYWSHLDRVEITHRRRFISLPRSLEKELGEHQFNELEKQARAAGVLVTGKIPAQILKILTILSRDSKIPEFQDMQWKVLVIDQNIANAFVLPGGYCVVYTGILPICKDVNGLATVLSHEAAHVLARHGAERLSVSMTVLIPLMLLAAALQIPFGEQLAQAVWNVFFGLPNSRLHETEADEIGVHLMARACLKPSESVHFWERFEEATKNANAPPEFLSTHPSNTTRRNHLISIMNDIEKERAKFCHH